MQALLALVCGALLSSGGEPGSLVADLASNYSLGTRIHLHTLNGGTRYPDWEIAAKYPCVVQGGTTNTSQIARIRELLNKLRASPPLAPDAPHASEKQSASPEDRLRWLQELSGYVDEIKARQGEVTNATPGQRQIVLSPKLQALDQKSKAAGPNGFSSPTLSVLRSRIEMAQAVYLKYGFESGKQRLIYAMPALDDEDYLFILKNSTDVLFELRSMEQE